MSSPGRVGSVRGIALASHLRERHVAERMAAACEAGLAAAGLAHDIARVDDDQARHAGANLTIWAESSTGCRFGADRPGKRGRTAESIGEFVAQAFLDDVRSGATVDRHVADQLVLFAALADGRSTYIVPEITDHVLSNVWLVTQFGARVTLSDRQVAVEGIALP